MFGEDRFAADEDFSLHYHQLGGQLSSSEINHLIRAVYDYLGQLYPDPRYHECFPSIASAIRSVTANALADDHIDHIVATLAFHELGHIPAAYVAALKRLSQRFTLAAVVDIWAPKGAWLAYFAQVGVGDLFAAYSFSSDHGIVKPSPKPFEMVLKQLATPASAALMIGDSVRRDFAGAQAVGVDCVLVGGASHPKALACFENLLAFCVWLEKNDGPNHRCLKRGEIFQY